MSNEHESPYVRPRPPVSTIDPAEFRGLTMIVQALVAVRASEFEQSGQGPAQQWINRLAEGIAAGTSPAGGSGEPFQTRSLEHVNGILAGVRFPREPGREN